MLVLCALLASAVVSPAVASFSVDVISACRTIQTTLSSTSGIYYPNTNSTSYDLGVRHWANSSSQVAACVVEPGTPSEVAKILRAVGLTRTPFAIKGGGHATNQGWSSTTGVHISMTRFNGIKYYPKTQTVSIGAGLIWDDVYDALTPYNVTVVGGRASGVGVAGFTLGGGYSYLTNQHGLTLDNVVEYELVLPTGLIVNVNAKNHPDLFFGLRGGFNNLGVVTRFTMKTYPSSQIWAGAAYISLEYAAQVIAATSKFQQTNKDPKASIFLTFNSAVLPSIGLTMLINPVLFYDAPQPAAGTFDDFLDIPTIQGLGLGTPFNTTTIRDFVIGVRNERSPASVAPRALFNTIGLTDCQPELLFSILNDTDIMGRALVNSSSMLVSFAIEPFLPSILSHSDTPSVYPAHRKQVYFPTNLYMSWVDPSADGIMFEAAKQAVARIRTTATALGQDLSEEVVYPNYAIAGEPVESFYGKANTKKLRALSALYDPLKVMSLAGGWKV